MYVKMLTYDIDNIQYFINFDVKMLTLDVSYILVYYNQFLKTTLIIFYIVDQSKFKTFLCKIKRQRMSIIV